MKVIIYHDLCQDGLFAALTAWKKFGERDAVYIPVNYKPIQDMTPEKGLEFIFSKKLSDRVVGNNNSLIIPETIKPEHYSDIDLIIVDYSFPVDHFKYHLTQFKSVLVLDHHSTAIDMYNKEYELEKNEHGWLTCYVSENAKLIFSKTESGAKLTHHYLFPEQELPNYITYANDRDLWKFEYPITKIFHAGIDAINCENFRSLELTIQYGMSKIIDAGNTALKMLEDRIKNSVRSSLIPIDIIINNKQYKGCLINDHLDIASDLCSYTMKTEGFDIAIAYIIKHNSAVSLSIRSIGTVDSSPISLKYDGGGHEQANGCHISLNELVKFIKNKKLTVSKFDIIIKQCIKVLNKLSIFKR